MKRRRIITVPTDLYERYEESLHCGIRFKSEYLMSSGWDNLIILPVDFNFERDKDKLKSYPVVIREEV